MVVNSSPQRISGSDRLGRYYTAQNVSALLVQQMDASSPLSVLDLGAGLGGLSVAAASRWTQSTILTVDVDVSSREALSKIFPGQQRHRHLSASALCSRLPERIRSIAGKVEAAVCNPPFIMPRWRTKYMEILIEAGFSRLPAVARDIEAPALFLAQNMRILSEGAPLGIILPDSMISAQRYRWFRQSLLENYQVARVVKLPRTSFLGTDALAHVVIIEKRAPTGAQIELCRFNSGRIVDQCSVGADDAIDRMDVDFHTARKSVEASGEYRGSLSERGVDIRRGSIEHAVARENCVRAFHTTDILFESLGKWIDLPSAKSNGRLGKTAVRAEAGDILIARVGRNLDTKIVGVRSGSALLTDCVYRLRAPPNERRRLLRNLSSPKGRAWLRSQAYGVGATHIAKASLQAFSY